MRGNLPSPEGWQGTLLEATMYLAVRRSVRWASAALHGLVHSIHYGTGVTLHPLRARIQWRGQAQLHRTVYPSQHGSRGILRQAP